MTTSYTSAAEFVRIVRNFAQNTPDWAVAVRHWVTPDEILDPTKISMRVYGNRNEFLAVMAAAGTDSLEQAITQRMLVMPTFPQLNAIKVRCGLSTDAQSRPSALAKSPIIGR